MPPLGQSTQRKETMAILRRMDLSTIPKHTPTSLLRSSTRAVDLLRLGRALRTLALVVAVGSLALDGTHQAKAAVALYDPEKATTSHEEIA